MQTGGLALGALNVTSTCGAVQTITTCCTVVAQGIPTATLITPTAHPTDLTTTSSFKQGQKLTRVLVEEDTAEFQASKEAGVTSNTETLRCGSAVTSLDTTRLVFCPREHRLCDSKPRARHYRAPGPRAARGSPAGQASLWPAPPASPGLPSTLPALLTPAALLTLPALPSAPLRAAPRRPPRRSVALQPPEGWPAGRLSAPQPPPASTYPRLFIGRMTNLPGGCLSRSPRQRRVLIAAAGLSAR